MLHGYWRFPDFVVFEMGIDGVKDLAPTAEKELEAFGLGTNDFEKDQTRAARWRVKIGSTKLSSRFSSMKFSFDLTTLSIFGLPQTGSGTGSIWNAGSPPTAEATERALANMEEHGYTGARCLLRERNL